MKTIFFDFNGTIINDVDLCLNILNEMLKENGLEPITLERYREIFTFPIKKYYQVIFAFSSGLFSRFPSSDSPLSSS